MGQLFYSDIHTYDLPTPILPRPRTPSYTVSTKHDICTKVPNTPNVRNNASLNTLLPHSFV